MYQGFYWIDIDR